MKLKNIFITCSVIIGLSNCNYLDYDETTGNTKEVAYGYFDNLTSLVSYIYSFLPNDLGSGSMMESATDNSVYSWDTDGIYKMYNNTWSAKNTIDTRWEYFKAIRAANSFLENFSLEGLDRFEFDSDYEQKYQRAKYFPYEVRFLRAYYYFELAIRYNNIPLMKKTYSQEEVGKLPLADFNTIIDFIVTECDEIIQDNGLPVKHISTDTGRITIGAVLALKSRALLFAASPLYNPEGTESKWEAAAKAAYALIKENWYTLEKVESDPMYKNGEEVLKSKQLILERRSVSKTNSFEARNQPMGFEKSQGGNTPTQNLVDAFEFSDGTVFDWNNPDHVSKIYTGREPRFYKKILYNGSKLFNKEVATYEGGANKVQKGSTMTGYYLKRFMDENVAIRDVNPLTTNHHFILFRYAEILLNYAEAMNEWLGPDITNADCPMSARDALTIVRESANLPKVTENGSEFTERLRNERRVELAFEGHRFWDLRRWKKGEEIENIYGVKIIKNGSNFTYQRMIVQNRIWEDKMYMYPIPQNELNITDNLVQNLGWE